MTPEFKKRLFTSILLAFLLLSMYLYSFIMIISVVIIMIISWVEFHHLISRIFIKSESKYKLFKFIYKSIFLSYLFLLTLLILYVESNRPDLKIFIIYSLLISILSDLGGLIFGKLLKGPKLTKISPKKTISGSIGSFISALLLIPFFSYFIDMYGFFFLIMITLSISLVSQFGDLVISFIKRKANVKNTSNVLPGHGGILDRIDGIIFAVPFGFLILNLFK